MVTMPAWLLNVSHTLNCHSQACEEAFYPLTHPPNPKPVFQLDVWRTNKEYGYILYQTLCKLSV